MNDPAIPIQIGTKLIANLFDPQPEELDLDAIIDNLKGQQRFASHPKALSVYQHTHLVDRLIRLDREHSFDDGSEDLYERVREWARHHDDHEGIIGDIVAPVKSLISTRTNVLEIVEVKLDRAICIARGIEYPNEIVRGLVHRYDKAAETLEWVFALGKTLKPFNHPCPDHLFENGASHIQWARQFT